MSLTKIPDDLLISDSFDPVSDFIDFVYPSILEKYNDLNYFQQRAILALLNEVVQDINGRFLASFPGKEIECLSYDSIDHSDSVRDAFDPVLYSPDFLNLFKNA